MNKGINLLPNKKGNADNEKKLLNFLRVFAIIFLSFLCVSSISLFLISQNYSSGEAKNKESVVLTNYSSVSSRMIKLFLIHDRLSEIQKVLSKRVPFDTMTAQIQQQIPQNVAVDAIRIDGKSIELTGSSTSLSTINTLLENLVSMSQNKKFFRTVTLKSLAYDGKEKYFVSLKMELL